MNNNSSKQILLSVLGVAILVVAVVGVSFAAFSFSQAGVKENKITTGAVTMSYSEAENGILIENMMPTTDATGKALKDGQNVFDFTVAATITGTTTINYTVSALKDTGVSTLKDNEVKLYLEQLGTAGAETGTEKLAPSNFTSGEAANNTTGKPVGEMTLVTDNFTATDTRYYRLKMWVADNYEPTGAQKAFSVKVNVYAKAAAA